METKGTDTPPDPGTALSTIGAMHGGEYRRLALEVGRWMACPPEMREYPSLMTMAQAMGYGKPKLALYRAMSSPAAALGAMVGTVGHAAPELPHVIDALIDAAKAGSVRAADTLLRHCREVVRMAAEASGQMPSSQHLHLHLEDTAAVARQLLATALSLQTGAEVRPPGRSVAAAPAKPDPPPAVLVETEPAIPAGTRWVARLHPLPVDAAVPAVVTQTDTAAVPRGALAASRRRFSARRLAVAQGPPPQEVTATT